MVKKNGLISENKTAIKNATDILSSSARKLSKSISTDYIEAVSLVTAKPKTSKNRKTLQQRCLYQYNRTVVVAIYNVF